MRQNIKHWLVFQRNLIITEGQEDVIMYNKAADALGICLSGTFFGWGSGGSSNISKIATILKDLGYQKVFAIFDGDKSEDKNRFEQDFPEYSCQIISAPDIRDKPSVKKDAKLGIMTEKGELKEEYKTEMDALFQKVNCYLQRL